MFYDFVLSDVPYTLSDELMFELNIAINVCDIYSYIRKCCWSKNVKLENNNI